MLSRASSTSSGGGFDLNKYDFERILKTRNGGCGMLETQFIEEVTNNYLISHNLTTHDLTVATPVWSVDIQKQLDVASNKLRLITAFKLPVADRCHFDTRQGDRVLMLTSLFKSQPLSANKLKLVKQLASLQQSPLLELLQSQSDSKLGKKDAVKVDNLKSILVTLDSLRQAAIVIVDLDYMTVRLSDHGRSLLRLWGIIKHQQYQQQQSHSFIGRLLSGSASHSKLDDLDCYIVDRLQRLLRPDRLVATATATAVASEVNNPMTVQTAMDAVITSYFTDFPVATGDSNTATTDAAAAATAKQQQLRSKLESYVKDLSDKQQLVVDASGYLHLVVNQAISQTDATVLKLFRDSGTSQLTSLTLYQLLDDHLSKSAGSYDWKDVAEAIATLQHLHNLQLLSLDTDNHSLAMSELGQRLLADIQAGRLTPTVVTINNSSRDNSDWELMSAPAVVDDSQ